MTETPTTRKTINHVELLEQLRPAKMELGIRRVSIDSAENTTAVYFEVGFAHSTSTVQVTLNALDLYDVEVFKYRGLKRTDLGSLSNVFAEDLARALVGEWCRICSRKGW